MNCILGAILGSKITGVERAQISKLKLSKQHGISSKYVYVKRNSYSCTYAEQHQIENGLFTMYDYFQKAINYRKIKQISWIQYWEESCRYTLRFVENSNDVRVYDEEQFVMYAHFLDKQYHQLNCVDYFNHKRRRAKYGLYDGRGFLSCSRILGEGQRIVLGNYYAPNREVVIQKYFNGIKGKDALTKIILNED